MISATLALCALFGSFPSGAVGRQEQVADVAPVEWSTSVESSRARRAMDYEDAELVGHDHALAEALSIHGSGEENSIPASDADAESSLQSQSEELQRELMRELAHQPTSEEPRFRQVFSHRAHTEKEQHSGRGRQSVQSTQSRAANWASGGVEWEEAAVTADPSRPQWEEATLTASVAKARPTEWVDATRGASGSASKLSAAGAEKGTTFLKRADLSRANTSQSEGVHNSHEQRSGGGPTAKVPRFRELLGGARAQHELSVEAEDVEKREEFHLSDSATEADLEAAYAIEADDVTGMDIAVSLAPGVVEADSVSVAKESSTTARIGAHSVNGDESQLKPAEGGNSNVLRKTAQSDKAQKEEAQRHKDQKIGKLLTTIKTLEHSLATIERARKQQQQQQQQQQQRSKVKNTQLESSSNAPIGLQHALTSTQMVMQPAAASNHTAAGPSKNAIDLSSDHSGKTREASSGHAKDRAATFFDSVLGFINEAAAGITR